MIIEGGSVEDIHRLAVEPGHGHPAPERDSARPSRGRPRSRKCCGWSHEPPSPPSTRTEWSTRLAQALVQAGYETDVQPRAPARRGEPTDQSLASLLISRNLALPEVVVGALSQLAQLPAVDLAGVRPRSPRRRRPCPMPWPSEFEAVASSSTATCWPWRSPSPRRQDDVRAGRSRSATGSTRCWPTRRSSPSTSGSTEPVRAGPAPSGGDHGTGRASPGTRPAVVEDLLESGHPGRGGNDGVPLHIDDLLRYAVSRRRLRPPPDGGHARRPSGCTAPSGPSRAARSLDNETIRDMVFGILPASQRERFEEENELDTSHSIAGVGRFRVNVVAAAGDGRRRPAAHPPRDAGVRQPRASPTRSGRSPTCGAAWCWSPARPARASRPPWRR